MRTREGAAEVSAAPSRVPGTDATAEAAAGHLSGTGRAYLAFTMLRKGSARAETLPLETA